MKFISIFDVIGPDMIGPSSSHTAGAAAIGNLTRSLFKDELSSVTITLYGSFASTYNGHGTDKALLGGVLGLNLDDVNIRNSFQIAKQQNVNFEFVIDKKTHPTHPNTATLKLVGSSGELLTTTGVSLGGGRVKIIEINNIEVDFTGEYSTLIINQTDTCGVAAHITDCMKNVGVNIAFLRIFRENKGEKAYTIIESDEQIPPDVIHDLKTHPMIHSVMLVQI